jgi:hypothetical protein
MFIKNMFSFIATAVFAVGFSIDSFAVTRDTRSVSKTTTSGSANNRTYTTERKVYSKGHQVESSTTRTTVKKK